jgi:YggT family protein
MDLLFRTLVWLLGVVSGLLQLYAILIIVAVVLSWVNADPWNPIVRTIRAVTEPVLDAVRRVVPLVGPLDLSPMVVILLISFLQAVVIPYIRDALIPMRVP